ncbi:MAG: thioesterase family protein [Armatimonadaceae bacterium]
MPPLTATVAVRTYELDSFGHVNNAVYLQYVEEARSEFLKQMGLSFHDFARHGVQFVIVEAELRYLRPARYGDELVITGRFRDVRAASAVLEYTLTDKATGQTVATASTKGAFVDAATGKPTRAPEPFRKAFAANAAPIDSP